jgi:hypothetical protein
MVNMKIKGFIYSKFQIKLVVNMNIQRKFLKLRQEALSISRKHGVPLVDLPNTLKKKYGPGMSNAWAQYATHDKRSATHKNIRGNK